MGIEAEEIDLAWAPSTYFEMKFHELPFGSLHRRKK